MNVFIFNIRNWKLNITLVKQSPNGTQFFCENLYTGLFYKHLTAFVKDL